MAINPNELVLDRVRELILTDLTTGEVLARLTSLEDPSLKTSADGVEVTDAVGALITKIYRSKKATFSATNSLFSLDLAAQQFGSSKEVAAVGSTITTPASQVFEVSGTTVTLAHIPSNDIKYIYKLESNNIAKKYIVAATASTTEFSIVKATGVITLPTDVTSGEVYVEYEYASASGVKIVNNTENFPSSVGVKIFSIFRNKCNDNEKWAGSIIASKGKIDPSSVEIALKTDGKHQFSIDFSKEFCVNDADLFSIIVAE